MGIAIACAEAISEITISKGVVMNVVNFPEIQALFPTLDSIYDLKEKLPYDELFRYCLMLGKKTKQKSHGLVKVVYHLTTILKIY